MPPQSRGRLSQLVDHGGAARAMGPEDGPLVERLERQRGHLFNEDAVPRDGGLGPRGAVADVVTTSLLEPGRGHPAHNQLSVVLEHEHG